MIGRRSFITLLGGAAAGWPLAARAQQRSVPVVGYLSPRDRQTEEEYLPFVRKGMSDHGFIEERNFVFDFRFAHGHYDLIPVFAEELVRRRVDVIIAVAATVAGRAAQNATKTIPIVFNSGTDPVEAGLVQSLNRPGGNITGAVSSITDMASKQLGLLRELLPLAATIVAITNPANPGAVDVWAKDAETAGRTLARKVVILNASSEREIDQAFSRLAALGADALLVAPDPLFSGRINQFIELAAQHKIPGMYFARQFATAGGLVSYGTDTGQTNRIVGDYVGRILKGAKPGDLPVQQPTKFEFVINLRTARTLGITVPPTLLAIADAVIE